MKTCKLNKTINNFIINFNATKNKKYLIIFWVQNILIFKSFPGKKFLLNKLLKNTYFCARQKIKTEIFCAQKQDLNYFMALLNSPPATATLKFFMTVYIFLILSPQLYPFHFY